MSANKCNFCGRKGLLIYPVRYAVACPGGAAGVPGLSGNFKIKGGPQQIGAARYTLRALRAGYLYTYDEKRARLKAYLVLPDGHLWNFPVEYRAPSPENTKFACTRGMGDSELAHCVDIEDGGPGEVSNFWIGWSNVEWTKLLIAKVGEQSWRKKHMQCINIQAMLLGTAEHAGDFLTARKGVAHLTAASAEMTKAFSFSNTPVVQGRDSEFLAGALAHTLAAKDSRNTGFIVAVNDPVGITNDLSELLVPNEHSGFDEDMCRGRVVDTLLTEVEKHVRAQAKKDCIEADKEAFAKTKTVGVHEAGGLGALVADAILRRFDGGFKKQEAAKAKSVEARTEEAANRAWKDFITSEKGPVLDVARRKNFPVVYEAAIQAFEADHEKLARAHLAWLRSVQLYEWMDGVHDTTDIRTGYAYTQSFAQCVGKAVASKGCADQLIDWLASGKISDTSNLYARAVLFNHKEIIAATEPHLKGSDFQFENLLNIYKGAMERLEKGDRAKLFDKLAIATANIIISALKTTATTVMRALALAHLTIIGGVPIKAGTSSARELAKWAIQEAESAGIKFAGTKMQTRVEAHAATRPPTTGYSPEFDVGFELDIARLERDGHISPGSIKGVKIPGVKTAQKWLGSGSPSDFGRGVATAIIQLFALGFAAKDLADNDKFNAVETRTKAVIAIVSLCSTIVDTVATTVEKAETHPLAVFIRGQWAMDKDIAAKIAGGARFVGLIAGIVAGGYDVFVNGVTAWQDKNRVLAILYVANGVLGGMIAIAAYFSAGAVFWPALITAFIVGIAIAIINAGAIKVWVSRCYFSVNQTANAKEEGYSSFADELRGYNNAIGG